MDIGGGEAVRIAANASWPRWSPDGRYVAFVRGNRIMRVAADGGGEEVLAEAAEARAVAYHPNGQEVLFTDDEAIKSVSIGSREVRTVVSGWNFREPDISPDGARLVASVRRGGVQMRGFDLAKGKDWRIAGGCSASFSPDAQRVTNNDGNHRALSIRLWESGRKVASVDAPPGRTFDNQFWSNDQDWIASITDDYAEDVFIHQVSQDRSFRVTSSGDCDRPDLFVERKN